MSISTTPTQFTNSNPHIATISSYRSRFELPFVRDFAGASWRSTPLWLSNNERVVVIVNIVIGSYLEPELVKRIDSFSDEIAVHYRPDLLPVPRYVCDH